MAILNPTRMDLRRLLYIRVGPVVSIGEVFIIATSG
jgi:hypothetical protein